MILDRVTFTGADNSIKPKDVVALAQAYPWTEWGILMIGRGFGNRFPTPGWIEELLTIAPKEMNLCAHLCGEWVEDIMEQGFFSFEKLGYASRFKRVQLNFHAQEQPKQAAVNLAELAEIVHKRGGQLIFQVDSVNDDDIKKWVGDGLGVPLFDVSGGAGVLPKDGWPKQSDWRTNGGAPVYCGYAGGLGPLNTRAQVVGPIAAAAVKGERIWIDMETRVRSNNDRLFDLDKVRAVCEQVKDLIGVEIEAPKEVVA